MPSKYKTDAERLAASQISGEDLTKLNINKDLILSFKEEHKKYIKYHRENKFKK